MARIRSMKPEFWSDRKLARSVSRDARLLYVALWNFSDEHGRLQGDARYVKGNCFPYDDDITLDEIDALLLALETAKRIRRYDHDGDPYIFLPKLAEHQRLEPAKVPSRLPAPPNPDADPDGTVPPCEPRADKSAPDADESALLYVAGSRGQVAGSRVAPRTQEVAIPDNPADAILREHIAAYDQPPPPSAVIPVRREVLRLVAENVEPARILAGLARMRDKRLAASLLPQLVSESGSTKSTTDQRVAQGLALVTRYEAEEQQ